jgi:hypothetical protein
MAGLEFDDLIPGGEAKPSGKPQGMAFDDLIPVTGSGLAKATGTGVVKGSVGLTQSLAGALGGYALGPLFQRDMKLIEPYLHKAENRPERFAETAGEFLPGSVGPGGVIRGAANLAKGAVAGVITEGAGQGAEALGASPGVERAVRFVTGLAAPVALSAGSIGKKPAAPTHDELVAEKTRNYKTM